MGCEGCGTKDGLPAGCGNNGYCRSGGCSRLEVFDWLADIPVSPGAGYDVHEVSFKNGARKDFFRNDRGHDIMTGDYVLVESGSVGYDVGRVSLSGELVRLQMRKKQKTGRRGEELKKIIRKAREKELGKLEEARSREKSTMLKARILARDLGLDMKLGDVEFQADLRKATFYYTADGRVDFRELIKVLAREFRVRIEMRQIGSRQEAGRVGGIGSCGRELCCSTWLTSFQSVNTSAARYQNLAINQTKLSGQCGRLKCCLNYELDTYMEAFSSFPDLEKARRLQTRKGVAYLVKTDILKGEMSYQYQDLSSLFTLAIEDVREVLDMNERGEQPENLEELMVQGPEEEGLEFEDVVGQISLQALEGSERRKRRKRTKHRPAAPGSRPPGNKHNRPSAGQEPSARKQGRGKRRGSGRSPGNRSTGGGDH